MRRQVIFTIIQFSEQRTILVLASLRRIAATHYFRGCYFDQNSTRSYVMNNFEFAFLFIRKKESNFSAHFMNG